MTDQSGTTNLEQALANMREAQRTRDENNQRLRDEEKQQQRNKERLQGADLGKALKFFGIEAQPEKNEFAIGEVHIWLKSYSSGDLLQKNIGNRISFTLMFSRNCNNQLYDYEGGYYSEPLYVQQQPIDGDWTNVHASFMDCLNTVNQRAEAHLADRAKAETEKQSESKNPNVDWLQAADGLDLLSRRVREGAWLSARDVLILSTVMVQYGFAFLYPTRMED